MWLIWRNKINVTRMVMDFRIQPKYSNWETCLQMSLQISSFSFNHRGNTEAWFNALCLQINHWFIQNIFEADPGTVSVSSSIQILLRMQLKKCIVQLTDTSKDWTQITIYIYIENLGNLNSFLSFTICWGLVWRRYDLTEKFFSTYKLIWTLVAFKSPRKTWT